MRRGGGARRAAALWTAAGALALVGAAAIAEDGAAPSAEGAPATTEPAPAHARAAASIDRSTAFGAKIQFPRAPIAPPATPIIGPDGAMTTLADHEGSVVVAVFWATWCPVCQQEMPEIDAFAASLGDLPIKILPVSLDKGDDAELQIEAFYDDKGIETLPIWIDQDQTNAGLIGLRGTPTAFVIDANGDLVAVVEGRGHWGTPEARRYLEVLAEEAG